MNIIDPTGPEIRDIPGNSEGIREETPRQLPTPSPTPMDGRPLDSEITILQAPDLSTIIDPVLNIPNPFEAEKLDLFISDLIQDLKKNIPSRAPLAGEFDNAGRFKIAQAFALYDKDDDEIFDAIVNLDLTSDQIIKIAMILVENGKELGALTMITWFREDLTKTQKQTVFEPAVIRCPQLYKKRESIDLSLTPDELRLLATRAAQADFKKFGESTWIEKLPAEFFSQFDEEDRFKIAKEFAENRKYRNPFLPIEINIIENLNLNSDHIFDISIIYSKNRFTSLSLDIIEHFNKLNRFSEEQIRRVLSEAIIQEPKIYQARESFWYSFTTEEIFELLKISADVQPIQLVMSIDLFDLTDEQLDTIASILIRKICETFIENIDKFRLSRQRKIEFAKRMMLGGDRNIEDILKNIDKLKLERKEQLELLWEAVLHNSVWLGYIKDVSDVFPNDILNSIFNIRGVEFERLLHSEEDLDKFNDQYRKNLRLKLCNFAKEHFPSIEGWVTATLDSTKTNHELMETIKALSIILFILKVQDISDRQIASLHEKGCLQAILDLRAPHLRCSLALMIAELGCSVSVNALQLSDPIEVRSPPSYRWHGPLLQAVLVLLQEQGVKIQPLTLCLNKSKAFNTFKDVKKFKQLLSALQKLQKTSKLTPEEKTEVLTKLAEHPETVFRGVRNLLMILDMEEESCLKNLPGTLEQTALEMTQKHLPPGSIEDMEKWHDLLDQCPDPQSLFIYINKMNLIERENIECLGKIIQSILTGTFRKLRYENEYVKAHPDFLPVWTSWQKGISMPLSEIFEKERLHETRESFNPFNWLYTQLVTDSHMDLTPFDHLSRYLEAKEDPAKQEAIWNEISTKRRTAEEEISYHCLGFARAKIKSDQTEFLTSLTKSSCHHFLRSEFIFQAMRQLSILKSGHSIQDARGYTVSLSDRWVDLFFAGTVGMGCQSPDGDPQLNKGLLGYLMNGQTQGISIHDSEGKIIARSLLRIYHDKNDQPVLFLCRHYSNLEDIRLEIATEHLAKRKAEEMGLPLITQDSPRANYSYMGGMLYSLGGMAPQEYFDETLGNHPHGETVVKDPCQMLFKPILN